METIDETFSLYEEQNLKDFILKAKLYALKANILSTARSTQRIHRFLMEKACWKIWTLKVNIKNYDFIYFFTNYLFLSIISNLIVINNYSFIKFYVY